MFLFMGISFWRCGFFETIEGTWTPGDQDLENVQLFFVKVLGADLCELSNVLRILEGIPLI